MIERVFRTRRWDPRSEGIWMTIYADMITNLVLVFLALYGLTVMGNDALAKAVRSMKYSEIKTLVEKTGVLNFESVPILLRKNFHGVQDLFIQDNANDIRIEFGENLLFPSGSAALKEEAAHHLKLAADVLGRVPYTVVVEGHTDSVRLKKGSAFHTNRELSLARSMAVAKWFILQGKMAPAQIAAAAYGEFKPRASNETADGRQMNRRVEILLKREFPFKLRQSGPVS